MSGYLHNLAARSLGLTEVIQPRLPSHFEPIVPGSETFGVPSFAPEAVEARLEDGDNGWSPPDEGWVMNEVEQKFVYQMSPAADGRPLAAAQHPQSPDQPAITGGAMVQRMPAETAPVAPVSHLASPAQHIVSFPDHAATRDAGPGRRAYEQVMTSAEPTDPDRSPRDQERPVTDTEHLSGKSAASAASNQMPGGSGPSADHRSRVSGQTPFIAQPASGQGATVQRLPADVAPDVSRSQPVSVLQASEEVLDSGMHLAADDTSGLDRRVRSVAETPRAVSISVPAEDVGWTADDRHGTIDALRQTMSGQQQALDDISEPGASEANRSANAATVLSQPAAGVANPVVQRLLAEAVPSVPVLQRISPGQSGADPTFIAAVDRQQHGHGWVTATSEPETPGAGLQPPGRDAGKIDEHPQPVTATEPAITGRTSTGTQQPSMVRQHLAQAAVHHAPHTRAESVSPDTARAALSHAIDAPAEATVSKMLEGATRRDQPAHRSDRQPTLIVRPQVTAHTAPVTPPATQIAPPAPPKIQVSIGRIEVRAAAPPSEPAPRPRATPPVLSLDDYLRRREEGGF